MINTKKYTFNYSKLSIVNFGKSVLLSETVLLLKLAPNTGFFVHCSDIQNIHSCVNYTVFHYYLFIIILSNGF